LHAVFDRKNVMDNRVILKDSPCFARRQREGHEMKNRALINALLTPVLAISALSASAEIKFRDVSTATGVANSGETYGSSWGDLDGDGYPDLFVSNHWNRTSMYLNKRDGTFADVSRQTFQWIWTPRADTHGGSWFDFDNDGDQDLFVATGIGNPDQFFLNDGGALVNVTSQLNASSRTWGGRLPVWMDYDNDGRPDFAMMMIGEPVQLMRGTKTGFESQTKNVGLDCTRQQYGQFIDANGDGKLEFVCPDDQTSTARYPNKIYDTQPTPWAGINVDDKFPSVAAGPDAIIADFNNDGHMDIFQLSGMQTRPSGAEINSAGNHMEARLMGNGKAIRFAASGPIKIRLDSNVFHDDPNTTIGYSWVHIGANGDEPTPDADGFITLDPSKVQGMPANTGAPPQILIGYENNRWTVMLESKSDSGESVFTDTYFEINGSNLGSLEQLGFWPDDFPHRPTLLMYDDSTGGFVDATPEELRQPIECVSAAAGDFNNDTRVDLYLACRAAVKNIENMLFENGGNGQFVRVASAGGAAGPLGFAVQDSAGTADSVTVADYDADGHLDLFVTNGFNMFPKTKGGPNLLFKNVSDDNNHWIEFDLVGTKVHREAHGAVVTITGGGVTQTRVKNGSYHRWSHDSTRMHFGLAGTDKVDISVKWPDGSVDNYEGVTADSVYRLVQGKTDVETVVPGNAPPYACGLPDEFQAGLSSSEIDAKLEPGIYIAKNCSVDLLGLDSKSGVQTGGWLVRAVKGSGDTITFPGHIASSGAVSVRTRDSLNEDHDKVDVGDQTIDFTFEVRGGQDGMDFATEFRSNTCITLDDLPQGAKVFYGPLKTPVDSKQFYLNNLKDCPDGVPEVPDLQPLGGGDNSGGDTGGDSGGDNNNSKSGGGGGGGAIGLPLLVGLLARVIVRRYRELQG
jgi:hypothetical protein